MIPHHGGNHLFIVFCLFVFVLLLVLFCDCLDVSLLGWLVVASRLCLFVHIVFYCSSTFSQLPDTHLFVLTSSFVGGMHIVVQCGTITQEW